MKRFIIFCGLMAAIFLSHAGPVEFVKSIPENNSEITSWNFTLKFDITSALTDCEGKEVGLGYYYSKNKKSPNVAILYKGDSETGEELGQSLTSSLYGTSDAFKVNGDEISMDFDENIPIIPGQLYTIVITNRFALYENGTPSMVNATILKCIDNPIVLNFIGGQRSDHLVVVTESTLVNGDSCEELNEFTFNFFEPVVVGSNAKFDILKDGNPFFSTAITDVENEGRTIKIPFEDPLYFDYSHTYTCIIPANCILNREDRSVSNDEIRIEFSGLKQYVLPIKSQELILSDNNLPHYFRITLDLPEDRTLTLPPSHSGAVFDMLYLFDSYADDDSSISSFRGIRLSDGNTIEWDLSSFVWSPNIKYTLRNSSHFEVYDLSGASSKEYQEYSIQTTSYDFSTPSIEEMNFPKIELNGIAKLGDYLDASVPDFVDGRTYDYLNTIELGKKEFVLDGAKYNPVLNWGNQESAFLYDVTSGKRVLVKEFPIRLVIKETTYEIFSVYQLNISSSLYSGHKYEIVIPSGTLRIANAYFSNYVTNDEIVFNVNGSAVSEFKVVGCSVSDNEEMSQLPPAVVWQLEGAYSLASTDAKAKGESFGSALGSAIANSEPPIVIRHDGKYTYVYVYLTNYDGSVHVMRDGLFFALTIPEGTIIYPGDETIKNPELKVTIKGINPKSDDLEFVNTTVTLADNETNEAHSFIVETVKGYPAKIQMLPGENWNVADVAHEGKSLTAVNGVYASEPLNEDSKIVAKLAYYKDMLFDQTTGVYSVKDTHIKVYTENNQIVVSGLTQPTNIAVYSVGGILVKQMTTDAAYDMVRISAEPNEIYVVVINGQAAKVRL